MRKQKVMQVEIASNLIGTVNMTANLVDEGIRLSEQIKALDKQLSDIKEKIKAEALLTGQSTLEGTEGVCQISSAKNWVITPSIAYNWLKKTGKLDQFDMVFKANITNIKKYLGEITLGLIGAKSDDDTIRLSFKRRG